MFNISNVNSQKVIFILGLLGYVDIWDIQRKFHQNICYIFVWCSSQRSELFGIGVQFGSLHENPALMAWPVNEASLALNLSGQQNFDHLTFWTNFPNSSLKSITPLCFLSLRHHCLFSACLWYFHEELQTYKLAQPSFHKWNTLLIKMAKLCILKVQPSTQHKFHPSGRNMTTDCTSSSVSA